MPLDNPTPPWQALRRGFPFRVLMSDALKGILALVCASTIWGMSGIYFDQVAQVPALEVLAHRVVWSLVFFLLFFAIQGRLGELRAVLTTPRLAGMLSLTTLMVSVNWFGFIWSIQNGHATEASLGYYIFPLVAVLLGYIMFRERFSLPQIIAILLAAVAVLSLTLGLGQVPWIALLLSATFGIYGSLKKVVPVGPVMSVACEVAILSPLALALLVWLALEGRGSFGSGAGLEGWLMLSAAFTGLPLVLFSYGSKRLNYATLGLIQYLNPTYQFIVAMVYFAEPFTRAHAVAFPLIWFGVALYCLDLWRQDRSARRRSMS